MEETIFNTAYLIVGIGLAAWGAWMLLFTGRVFLGEAFQQNGELVRAMSHVLAVSFSSGMCGFLFLAGGLVLPQQKEIVAWNAAFVYFGWLVLFMAMDLFFHLFVLSQMRGRGRRRPRHDEHHGESILA